MTTSQSNTPLTEGAVLGRYTVGRCIGRGGMGAVYEAVHNDLKKRVAIKVLDPKLVEDPEVSARFLREGESAARIQHPHVVDIYDLGTQDDITYLVMELLVGEDLRDLLKRTNPLSSVDAADIMLPVCAALAAAHARQVVHRDLKPANIFLARGVQGTVIPKVLDFGISKIIDAPLQQGITTTGAILGTPNYMSPEQAHGGRVVDQRTDIYSLGVVLYQCVTGIRPFVADSMYQILHRIVQGEFEPPRVLNPDIDTKLEAVMVTAMAGAPEQRYADMNAFGAALLPFASPRQQAVWAPIFDAAVGSSTTEAAYAEAAYAEPVAPPPFPPTLDDDSALDDFDPYGPRRRIMVLLTAAALMSAMAIFIYFIWLQPSPKVVAVPLKPPPLSQNDGPGASAGALPPEKVAPKKVASEASAPEAPPPIRVPDPPSFEVVVEAVPPTAQIMLDGRAVGRGRYRGDLPQDGETHRLTVRARGYRPHEATFTDRAPPAKIILEQLPPVAPPPIRRPPPSTVIDDPGFGGDVPLALPPPPAPVEREELKKGVNEAPILR